MRMDELGIVTLDVWLVYGGSIDYEIIGFDNSNNRKLGFERIIKRLYSESFEDINNPSGKC